MQELRRCWSGSCSHGCWPSCGNSCCSKVCRSRNQWHWSFWNKWGTSSCSTAQLLSHLFVVNSWGVILSCNFACRHLLPNLYIALRSWSLIQKRWMLMEVQWHLAILWVQQVFKDYCLLFYIYEAAFKFKVIILSNDGLFMWHVCHMFFHLCCMLI